MELLLRRPLLLATILAVSLAACASDRRGRGGGGGGGGGGGLPPGEGEGDEGEGEGEGEGPAEGEGEGAAEGEGEGPSEGEGEGEGPSEGEGEGPACVPEAETCNGVDDDCDGRIDEDDPELGEGCSTGLPGPCWQGRLRCEEGALACVGVVQPGEELCNGLDDDCDGEADEDAPQANEECESEVPGICGFGRTRCANGILHCDPVDPEEELCDGLDNDCNGLVDEGAPGHEEPCLTGLLGVCGEGIGWCENGVFDCVQQEEPSREECDGRDNDCDGEVDEDDGQGECTRPNVMLCGSSSRDIATFFPAGSGLRRVNGCAPDVETQALMISRSGAFPAREVLRAYLEGGGIVITEWNKTDEVYSAVFEPAAQGERRGSCRDNIATVVQFSPADRFWQDNEFRVMPEADTGCGYSITHFPDLVPLAGWDAASVCLGYRTLGGGRLWALDIDWQDTDAGQNQDTRDLLGYMIMNR